jgi:hypothetical protein
MSHFVEIVTVMTDLKALVRALERVGFKGKIELHDNPQNLFGYQGDKRKEKAHVIIRKQHVGSSSNDIGFEKIANGKIVSHISEFDQGKGQYASSRGKYNDEWQTKLCTWYGVEKAKMELEKKGLAYFEDLDDKERPRLKVMVPV